MLVTIENLSFRYRKYDPLILNNVFLTVQKGEILSLVGPSGCGKSTLLRLLAGLELPTSGCITIGGKIVNDEDIFIEPNHRNIGMVFQDYALFPHMKICDNIAYGLRDMSKELKEERVTEMLQLIDLEAHANKYPHELSGGQQQRVALARSLCPQPHILLLDEPFSNLDADLRKQIRQDVKNILDKAQITAILVTHDIEDAEALGARIFNMNLNHV